MRLSGLTASSEREFPQGLLFPEKLNAIIGDAADHRIFAGAGRRANQHPPDKPG